MDSAKNKKSFPDFTQTAGYPKAQEPFAAFSRVKDHKFELPTAFWERLDTDPELKAEFELRCEKRAREILEKEAEPRRLEIFAAAKKEGFDSGVREGRDEVLQSSQKLEALAETVLQEKQKLLHAHEAIWCQAVSHLMKRFLVPMSAERLKNLKAWLEEAIGDLNQHSKIRVLVSPKTHKSVATALVHAQLPHWEWLEDRTLQDGDFRVELTGGGVFFSAENEWKKFETKLNEIFGVTA